MKNYFINLMIVVYIFIFYTTVLSAQRNIIYPDSIDNNFFRARDARLKYWDTVGVDKRKGEYKQFNRWLYFWERRVLDNGDFPPSKLYFDAWNNIKLDNLNIKTQNRLQSIPNWIELGPQADPPGSGINAGVGRINVIKANPNDTNELWAGSASGGVWKSTNAGENWIPLAQTEFLSLGISDIEISNTNPSIVYVATGDNDGAITTSFKFYSIGIIKTTDGGKTWNIAGDEFYLAKSILVTKLWVHPNDENIVIAATNKGIMKTIDGGNTWRYTTSEMHCADIKQKPDDPNVLFACSMTNITSGSDGFQLKTFILKTTDGGENWEIIKEINDSRRTCLAVTPSYPELVYALSANKDGGFLSLIRTDDVGMTWENMNLFSKNKKNYLDWGNGGQSTRGQGYYDLSIAVDPKNPDKVFIGGINIWKSNDGGLSFELISHWYGGYNVPYVHADVHDLRFIGNKLYSGHDGGIDYTYNEGGLWTALNDGLGITQFYRFSNSKQNPYRIIAGAQDIGTRGYGFVPNQWSFINGGDGMDCAFDPKNDNICYFSLYHGSFYRREGNNRKTIIDPKIVYSKFNVADTGAWITPLAIDPVSSNNIYVGYANIYKSNDKGDNWEKLTDYKYYSYNLFQVIRVSPSNNNYIYAMTSSRLIMSSDGGLNFNNITVPGNGYLSDLCIHPTNPEVIYIVRSGYNENKVLKYDGKEWIDMTGNLPNISVNCIYYQPNTEDRIYVGTDIGVYTCSKNVPFYIRWGVGLPMLCVSELDIVESIGSLRAATYGRGIWEVKLNNCISENINIKYDGITTFCEGDSLRMYIEGDHKDIMWSTGETTPEIYVKSNGRYWVATNIYSECPKISENQIEVTVHPKKILKINTSKDPSFCEGDSVILSIPLGFNTDSYLWSTGEETRKITVKTPGVYWATAVAGNNDCRSYDTIIVNTYPMPEEPKISILTGYTDKIDGKTVKMPDTLIVTPEAVKYRWYKDNNIIQYANEQKLVFYESGNYHAEISTGGECWRGSEKVLTIEDEIADNNINIDISPNPAKSYIEIKLNQKNNNLYLIDIVDAFGKNVAKIKNFNLGVKTLSVDISNFAIGTYFVKVISNDLIITKPFIKE